MYFLSRKANAKNIELITTDMRKTVSVAEHTVVKLESLQDHS